MKNLTVTIAERIMDLHEVGRLQGRIDDLCLAGYEGGQVVIEQLGLLLETLQGMIKKRDGARLELVDSSGKPIREEG